VLGTPEFNVSLFAFLLNYPWEFLQVPFFDAMPDMAHWEAVLFCTRATGGDVVIALVAFGAIALARRSREWVVRPRLADVAGFVMVAVVITMVLEWHATEVAERWTYSELMPTLPIVGTGLLPLSQWIVLPPLMIWLTRRQILGHRRIWAVSTSR
jgi:hypothetical protein